MKDYVRLCRARGRETFVPLAHPPGSPCACAWGGLPGHGQVDFGEAVAVIGGVRQKIHSAQVQHPYEAINALWNEKPDIFKTKPHHHNLGLNT